MGLYLAGGSQVNRWIFSITVMVNGELKRIPITGVDQTKPIEALRMNPPFFEHAFVNSLEGAANVVGLLPALNPSMQKYIAQHKGHVESPTLPKEEFLTLKGEALKEASRMENPHTVKIAEADCVSCHLTTRLLLKAQKETEFPLSANAMKAISALTFVPPAGVSNKISDADLQNKLDGNRLINFGYRDEVMSISQRTANETAALIPLVNGWK